MMRAAMSASMPPHFEVIRIRAMTDLLTVDAHEHLARYKTPRSISWLDGLPKTGSGKVLKRELRRPFWEGHGSNV